VLFCQIFVWLAGAFVGKGTATPGVAAFVSEAGAGGAAIEASFSCGPAGPDCIDCDSKLFAVGGITGSGCETGNTGPDGMAVAEGISICAGLGTVTSGRAGSGTTVAVAASGAFVSPDASWIVTAGDGKVVAVPSCPPRTTAAKLAINKDATSNRVVVTGSRQPTGERGFCLVLSPNQRAA
jgi:hypothetical protein